MPRILGWSSGGGRFLMSEVPLYATSASRAHSHCSQPSHYQSVNMTYTYFVNIECSSANVRYSFVNMMRISLALLRTVTSFICNHGMLSENKGYVFVERDFFTDTLLVRIHFIIEMTRWTGLASWEFELFSQVALHLPT